MESRNSLAFSKVKRHPSYRERSPESQQSLADDLTDPVKIKDRFAHLLKIDEYVNSIKESDACELTHSLEYEKRNEQQKRDAALAAYLPVKLILSKLRRGIPPAASRFTTLLRFAFGPLHAGLVVGDVCIEWDDSSLIVPMLARDNPGDFAACVDSGASWQDGARQVVRDMSIANRQNVQTSMKLGIIYNYRDQKERLIDDLVDLIIEYNRSKKYGLFRCNCQDFVKDALKALRFHKELKFDGSLGNYFETLKRGVVANSEFDTHEQLDEYVKAHMEAMDKRDMEYLLCLYFQFHSAESRLLSPEEQDEWECPIESCLCGTLDHKIDNEALLLLNRRPPSRGRPRAHHVSVPPTTQSVPEEATGTIGIAEEGEGEASPESLARRHEGGSVEDQSKLLSKHSGYSKQVLTKLQAHPKYRGRSADSLFEQAEVLSEKERFHKAYFSSYIQDSGMKMVLEASSEFSKQVQPNGPSFSPDEVRRRANERYERLFNVDMNLIIRAPTRRDLKTPTAKAPVVVGLQVGNFVFEWNETSLIIPLEYAEVEMKPRLLSPVLPKSDWCCMMEDVKIDAQQSINEAVESKDYSMQIKLHFEVTQKKDKLLSAFIDTVLIFNRHKSYSWRCNNQAFLTEAMKSLGIRKPPKLSTSIAEHIRRLAPDQAICRKRINDHKDLDAVTLEVIGTDLSREDIEYLVAKYFLFHVSGWEREDVAEGAADKWECSVPGCKQQELTKMLEGKTSISITH